MKTNGSSSKQLQYIIPWKALSFRTLPERVYVTIGMVTLHRNDVSVHRYGQKTIEEIKCLHFRTHIFRSMSQPCRTSCCRILFGRTSGIRLFGSFPTQNFLQTHGSPEKSWVSRPSFKPHHIVLVIMDPQHLSIAAISAVFGKGCKPIEFDKRWRNSMIWRASCLYHGNFFVDSNLCFCKYWNKRHLSWLS